MFLQLEDSPLISADALKDSIPVKQSVVKDRNLCLFLWVKFPVDVNDHSLVCQPSVQQSKRISHLRRY